MNTTGTTTLCCDRCGRSLEGKGYVINYNMFICGVCDYEIKNSESTNNKFSNIF